jgi:hemin uptake protein HemP
MKTVSGQANRVAMPGNTDVGDDRADEAQGAPIRSTTVENLPEYTTDTLFAGRREIVIHHAGAAYRMKITKQGKLILNK